MNEINYSALYKQLIKTWSQTIAKHEEPKYFYKIFLNKIEAQATYCIVYDNMITEVIVDLLKSFQFQVFSKDYQQTEVKNRRKSLFLITDVLYQEGFVGKVDRKMVFMQEEVYIINKLEMFIESCSHNKQERDDIQKLWTIIVGMDLVTFWNLMQNIGIRDPILAVAYYKVCKCRPLLNDQSTASYINSFKKSQSPEVVAKPPQLIRIPSKKQRPIASRLYSSALRQIDPIKFDSQRQYYKMRKNKQYQDMWFNSNKYQQYQSYINSLIQNSNSQIEILLTSLAYDQALFFNPKYKNVLQYIYNFIEDMQSRLQNRKIVSYEFFGSIRSTLALANEFDIDLTSIIADGEEKRQPERKEIVDLLFEIKRTLQRMIPTWVSKPHVFNFPNLRVPFLKIQLDKEELFYKFDLIGIGKLDVTVGNKTAIKNSEIIGYFARIPEVACFCLLVKLWAKNNSVINAKTPMKGLSSYGVILMCLYYLMETKQIDFLYFEGQFDIDKSQVTPNVDHCELLDLEENFNGFLYFYRETGVFQKKEKIVCLLKDCREAQSNYTQDFVINMYDFIDKTNPGRLPYNDKSVVFDQIERAIRTMKTRNGELIKSLILRA